MAAFDAGVKAPEVVGVLGAGDGLGTGYVMRRVMGEVSPAAILDAPPPSLLGDLARELARIHAVPLEKVPAAIPLMRSEEHTSELQSLMRISYAVFCLKKKTHSSNSYMQRRTILSLCDTTFTIIFAMHYIP